MGIAALAEAERFALVSTRQIGTDCLSVWRKP
jgi:hypothetical protein